MDNLLTRPLFITFEGIENSGKGTQLLNFIEFLIDNDNDVLGDKYSGFVYHREPTKKTPSGIAFNEKLANHEEMTAEQATDYVIRDRLEHQKIIEHEIGHNGFFYICSRYADSTGAYQVSQGADWKDIYDRHHFKEPGGTRMPDITIYLDISVEESLRRSKKQVKQDLFDTKKDLLKKLEDAYAFWFERTSERHERIIIRVNGEQSPEKVAEEMKRKVAKAIRDNHERLKP
ncbi:MAG: dTMP kinase [Nanoarchaeota archaeon]